MQAHAAWAELGQANRLYRLAAPRALQSLRVEAWTLREAVSHPFELRLLCLSLDARIELKTLVDEQATLQTVLADGRVHERCGFIRRAELLGAEGGLARYRLTLVPWLWLATQQGRSQVFQQRGVADIIEQVLAPYADAGPWTFSPEVPEFLADAPERTYCTQYRESDYAFFSRLLAEEGLGWRVEQQADAPMGHRVVIFAESARQGEREVVRFHRRGAQEQADAVQALIRRMRQSVAQVHLSVWDADAKRRIEGNAPARWPVGGPRAARIEWDDVLGLHDQARGWADSATLARYAVLLMESAECRADTLVGHASVRSLACGTRWRIDEAPALGLKEAPDLFIDSVEHVGINNLPRDSAQAIEATLGGVAQHLVFDNACAAPDAEPDTCGLMPSPAALAAPPAWSEDDTDEWLDDWPGNDWVNEQAEVAPQEDHPAPALVAAAQASGYANRFGAMRAERPWRPALVSAQGARLHHKPTAHGVHTAIVVGPQGEDRPDGADELYCNARGDIRVRFHWQQQDGDEGEARPDNRYSRWVRVAQRQAGPGMGWQWLPRIGQEVLVRFVEGDVDQPIVIGTLYNGRGEGGIAPTPGGEPAETDTSAFAQAHDGMASAQANLAGGRAPAWHGAGAGFGNHRNSAALWGFKTKEFGGSGFSQLVFDDTDEQLRVQLHASTAHSQLNLGHLIHQQDNYRGSLRGQGFELRSDAYTAVRGGAGVLLSTYHGPGGARLEPTGDIAAGMALFKQVSQLGQVLSDAAGTHQTTALAGHLGAQKSGQSVLDEERAPLKAMHHSASGTVAGSSLDDARADAQAKHTVTGKDKLPHTSDSIIAVTAKAGLAAVAGQHLQMVAGETITLAAGGDINLALADELRIHSGQSIGWLAGAAKADADAGLNIVAAKDDITVQAQHDELKLQARDSVTLKSTTQHIDLAAAKRIRIATAQGASLTIEGGNITFECPGTITYKAAERRMAGAASMDYPLPANPNAGDFQRYYVLRRATDSGPIPNQKYRITTADGRLIEGTSNTAGETNLAQADNIQNVRVELLND